MVALVVSNRSLLAIRWLRKSCSLVAGAARLSRYLSSLSTVLEGIVALSARTAVVAAVTVP